MIAAPTAQGLAPGRLTWRSALAALHGITRGQLLIAFLFGCAYFLYEQGGVLQLMMANPDFPNRPILVAITFAQKQLAAFTLLACIAVAEHVTGKMTRQAAYLVAIVVSAAIVGPLKMIPRAATYPLGAPGTAGAHTQDLIDDVIDALCGGFFQWLIIGGAATFLYVDYRRARAARARMHAAELERTRAARRTLESRLQALQARVEPQFLFNTLSQVHELYRVDAVRGERMLDELIAYLHAAMPKMRDTSSTVGQEIELVRAYLAIVRLRLGGRLAYEIAPVESAVAEARMPPMMLLPLVDHAIAHGLAEPQANGWLQVRTEVADGSVRLEIADSGVGFLPESEDAGIASIRERLAALYDTRAKLSLRAWGSRATKATLEIPVEAIPRAVAT